MALVSIWRVTMKRIVFSDLDGTLLDFETQSCKEAATALALLKDLQVPLVFCSSKTRAEMEEWRRRLENRHPFVVENGGAVFIPEPYFPFPVEGTRSEGGYIVYELGERNPALVEALAKASRTSRVEVRAFHQMTAEEVSARFGILPELVLLAKQREYDEPFEVIDAQRAEELVAAIRKEGKRCTRSDRFYHILGGNDKGAAVRFLIRAFRNQYGSIETVGLGDALNDIPLLESVDIPVVVQSHYADRVRTAVPQAKITNLPGPAGWNEAVLELFEARSG
jgi:mannosyl-3-phosphoglycerate phosphatase